MNSQSQKIRLLGVTVFGLALGFMNPACGGSSKKNTNSNQDTSSGGDSSSSGGASNSGGASSGGNDSANAGNPGVGGAYNDQDADIVSDVSCTKDEQCTALGMICDLHIARCVKCVGPACAPTNDDSGVACVSSGGNPCTQIPSFDGTQVVDGQGNEFCDIAPMRLDADNAGRVISYNAEPPEVLTARVAASATGLHVYIEVVDSSVQGVDTVDSTQSIGKAYQGDSVELMFSASNNVTGLTGTDASTLHVIIPAKGPAVSTKAANSNGASQGTATALPAAQYAQRLTGTGYAIEARLPWPGRNAPAIGTNIRFDLALNSADATFGNVDDMRDGQLIYHLENVSNSTCQGSSDGTVPFCDDRTWCTTTIED
jgi:hypothetical protein